MPNPPSISDFCYLSKKHASITRTFGELLWRRWGISYFALQKVTHQGLWNNLGNDISFYEQSIERVDFWSKDLSLRTPKFLSRGITLPRLTSDPSYQNFLDGAATFDLEHHLVMVTPTLEGADFFYCAAPKAHHNILGI